MAQHRIIDLAGAGHRDRPAQKIQGRLHIRAGQIVLSRQTQNERAVIEGSDDSRV